MIWKLLQPSFTHLDCCPVGVRLFRQVVQNILPLSNGTHGKDCFHFLLQLLLRFVASYLRFTFSSVLLSLDSRLAWSSLCISLESISSAVLQLYFLRLESMSVFLQLAKLVFSFDFSRHNATFSAHALHIALVLCDSNRIIVKNDRTNGYHDKSKMAYRTSSSPASYRHDKNS